MSFPRDLRIGIPAVLGGLLVVLRCVQVSQRTLYWDDLVIPAKFSPLSFTGLFRLYDNHLMPGSALVQALVAGNMSSEQLIAQAFGGLAEQAQQIGSLNISPELLASLTQASKRK